MSLEGSIQTIGLPDVLNLLASAGKSGELNVDTRRGRGRLWFDGGRLSDHDVAHCPEAVDALFELLRADEGTFSFSDRAERTGGDLAEVGPLLAAAQRRLKEWKVIAAVVPSVDHGVRLVDEPEAERVELDKGQWALVLAVGHGSPVRRILDRRGLGEFDGCGAIKDLVDAGLAVVEEPAAVVAALGAPAPPALDVTWSGIDGATEWTLPAPAGAAQPASSGLLGPEAQDLLRAAVAEVSGADAEEREIGSPGAEVGFDVDVDVDADGPDDCSPCAGEPAVESEVGAPGDVVAELDDAAPVVPADHGEAQMALRAMLLEVGATSPAEGGGQPEEADDPGAAGWAPPIAPTDGLADRGPWTNGELAGLEHSEWWPGQGSEGSAGSPTGEPAEPATPVEEPINRGLLLKFLSSVRS